MHDHAPHTVAALEIVLIELRSRGYQLTTVSQLSWPTCATSVQVVPYVPPPEPQEAISALPLEEGLIHKVVIEPAPHPEKEEPALLEPAPL